MPHLRERTQIPSGEEKGGSKTGQKAPGRRQSRKPDAPAVFEQLEQKFQEKASVTYTMDGSYEKDDVIAHKTFGKGFVTDVSYRKMEVSFADASRTLVCDR